MVEFAAKKSKEGGEEGWWKWDGNKSKGEGTEDSEEKRMMNCIIKEEMKVWSERRKEKKNMHFIRRPQRKDQKKK